MIQFRTRSFCNDDAEPVVIINCAAQHTFTSRATFEDIGMLRILAIAADYIPQGQWYVAAKCLVMMMGLLAALVWRCFRKLRVLY
jgi:hypothetical protein